MRVAQISMVSRYGSPILWSSSSASQYGLRVKGCNTPILIFYNNATVTTHCLVSTDLITIIPSRYSRSNSSSLFSSCSSIAVQTADLSRQGRQVTCRWEESGTNGRLVETGETGYSRRWEETTNGRQGRQASCRWEWRSTSLARDYERQTCRDKAR